MLTEVWNSPATGSCLPPCAARSPRQPQPAPGLPQQLRRRQQQGELPQPAHHLPVDWEQHCIHRHGHRLECCGGFRCASSFFCPCLSPSLCPCLCAFSSASSNDCCWNAVTRIDCLRFSFALAFSLSSPSLSPSPFPSCPSCSLLGQASLAWRLRIAKRPCGGASQPCWDACLVRSPDNRKRNRGRTRSRLAALTQLPEPCLAAACLAASCQRLVSCLMAFPAEHPAGSRKA